MTELVSNGETTITFATLLIVRLRFQLWIEYSLTIFARGRTPKAVRRFVRWI